MFYDDNSIQIDFMTKTYQHLLNGAKAQAMEEPDAFQAALARKVAQAGTGSVPGAFRVMDVPTKNMTLEQYKNYIRDKISQIPLHPSQRLNSISVHISDEGFEAMQNDPEYEKWVLDTLRANFRFNDPFANMCGGSFSVHYFGATKGEYHGHGWYKGFQNGRGESLFNKEAKDSFWERRLRHKKLMKEQYERWLEKKWEQDKRLEKMYAMEMYYRSVEQMHRIAGEEYQSPERRLPVINTSYHTSQILDLLMQISM
ncbi:MAG: hypothetical protein J1F02_07300 [Lachnospiraceae bacterium]|nr:hypothetical protein [Lachnospiraceae bacterium]